MLETIKDREAEAGVISGIFNNGYDGYLDVSDIITTETFTDDLHQIIYKVIDTHYKNSTDNLDVPTFYSHCNSLNFADIVSKPKIRDMIKTIFSSSVDSKSSRRLAAKIGKLEIGRNLRKVAENIRERVGTITGDESIPEILSLAEQPLFEFGSGIKTVQQDGPKKIFENIDEYLDYLETNPIQQIGLSSGFAEYDRAIGGGLRRKTVNMLAARAKVGKSAFCANAATNLIGNQVPVYFADTELSEEDQKHRMLACLSGVPYPLIETGQYALNLETKRLVREAGAILKDLPYYYRNISGMPFEDFIPELRRWVTKSVGYKDGRTNDCVIIYDYVKLMSDSGLKNLQEFQALGFLMTGLHNFMVKYDCASIATVQLNRDGITREDTDVAAGSDRLVWLCSNFTLFKPQSDEELSRQREMGIRQLYNRKFLTLAARHGPGTDYGDFTHARFEGAICRITEGPLNSNLNAGNNNEGFVSNSNEPF